MNRGWLHQLILDDQLKDETAVQMAWKDFEASFTLHDSHWETFAISAGTTGDLNICIDLDTVWQPEPIKSALAEKTSYMVLRFKSPRSIEISGVEPVGGYNSPIGGTYYDGKTLKFENVVGGTISVTPVEMVHIWLYDESGADLTRMVKQAAG